jgi:histidine triad (HIT) family protein
MDEECIFCRIGCGEIPADFLYSDDQAFVIMDISPKTPIHLLVMPFEHVTYLESFTQDREALLGHMMLVAREMAQREGLMESGYQPGS